MKPHLQGILTCTGYTCTMDRAKQRGGVGGTLGFPPPPSPSPPQKKFNCGTAGSVTQYIINIVTSKYLQRPPPPLPCKTSCIRPCKGFLYTILCKGSSEICTRTVYAPVTIHYMCMHQSPYTIQCMCMHQSPYTVCACTSHHTLYNVCACTSHHTLYNVCACTSHHTLYAHIWLMGCREPIRQ